MLIIPKRHIQIKVVIQLIVDFFYLIEKFDLSVASSQLHLFLFLGAVAAGTFFGGPIGVKIGR